MRVLIASGIVAPDIGGPSTFIDELVPAFVSRGHAVRVLAFGDTAGPRPGDACAVMRIPRGALPTRLAGYARAYRRMAARADVVLALGLLLPRPTPRGVPVVLKVPGDYAWERSIVRGWIDRDEDLEGFDARRHAWRVEGLKRWRRAEARHARRIIVPSEFLGRLVRSWGVARDRIDVVPNAVRLPAPDGRTRGELRAALGWPDSEPVLLVAARLVAWKHVDLVIEAMARVPRARLVVAGDGPERARLAARAAEVRARVEFTGTLRREDLITCMRAADYVVLYSGYEGLSHTLVEALASGTPVIASRRGGNPEVVTHGVNGLLVAHPDVNALEDALADALSPGRRDELAAGIGDTLARFDAGRMADGVLATLEAAIAARGDGRR